MRILIIRTSAMGDIVHSLPVIAALNSALPEAKLAWVVEKPFAPLLEGHPDLERVFSIELRRWRRNPVAGLVSMADARRSIDAFDADLALDLMGNHKAGAIAALTRAPRVLGLDRADRREPSSAAWMTDTMPARGTHTVDRTLSILRGLGIEPGPPDFGSRHLLPGQGEPRLPSQPYFVVQVGSGWANKTYPAEALGEVAKRISERRGVNGYVAHGPGDQQAAEEALAASAGALVDVIPVGLADLGRWLRGADLVIGGDTGTLHLADALGTTVLMILGPTSADRNGPYHQRHNTLRLDLPCSPCYRRFNDTQSCMVRLPVEAVADRAVRLLCGDRLTASDTLLRLTGPPPHPCRSVQSTAAAHGEA